MVMVKINAGGGLRNGSGLMFYAFPQRHVLFVLLERPTYLRGEGHGSMCQSHTGCASEYVDLHTCLILHEA